MNKKTQINPDVLARLQKLTWEQKEDISNQLGYSVQNINRAINRNTRQLLELDWIRVLLPYSGVMTLSEYVKLETITLPFEID
jgi:hypothetical protein